MPSWLTIIISTLQLLNLILQNKFENDKTEKARKDDLHAQLADAIKNRDTARINDIFNKLRS